MNYHNQDIQQLILIREDIQQEIASLRPQILQLQEITRRFVSQMDVFANLSTRVQEELKSGIQRASFEIAELAADKFSEQATAKIEDGLFCLMQKTEESHDQISPSNQFIKYLIVLCACLTTFLIGAICGYVYFEYVSYAHSKNIIEGVITRKVK